MWQNCKVYMLCTFSRNCLSLVQQPVLRISIMTMVMNKSS
uniref:Uncharacterized protein n=1 Tax=Anguilla anguilla TaxID=7936 RepID=A0A0E9QSD8_ANGAN